jgi:hypothetical protein
VLSLRVYIPLGEINLLTSLHLPFDVTRQRPTPDPSEICGVCGKVTRLITLVFFRQILLLYLHSTFIQLSYITVEIRTTDVKSWKGRRTRALDTPSIVKTKILNTEPTECSLKPNKNVRYTMEI